MFGSILYAINYKRELSDDRRSELLSQVTSERAYRIKRFAKIEDRDRSLLGEYLAKYLLSGILKRSIKEINFVRDEFGKPHCEDSEMNFNISHSDEWVICGVSSNPIGVDIERVRDVDDKIYDHVLTESEKVSILKLSPDEQRSEFFRYWSIKESCLKAFGKGLSIPPTSLGCNLSKPDITVKSNTSNYQLNAQEYSVDPYYSCAAAVLDGETPAEINFISVDELLI